MSDQIGFNFQATEFLLLRAIVCCWRCRCATRVQAIALPPGHRALSEPDEAGVCVWQSVPLPAVVYGIEALDGSAAQALRTLDAALKPPAAADSGWHNRCEHCDAPIEDLDLHEEPGAAFSPPSAADAAALLLERVREPIRVGASAASIDPPWFDDFLRG